MILKTNKLLTITHLKFVVTLSFLTLILGNLSAQDKTLKVKLNGERNNINYTETILEEIDLGEAGYLMKTGIRHSIKAFQKLTLYFFKSNGDLVWKKEIETIYILTSSPYEFNTDKLIASVDGAVVYDIQIKKKTLVVQQIVTGGDAKKIDLSQYGIYNNLQSAFCDNTYLYFLTTVGGNEGHKSKKAAEKLVLHRFSNSDFSYKKINLELPAVTSGENSSFWGFAGQSNALHFVQSKSVDRKNKKASCHIISFNADGNIKSDKTINLETSSNDFTETKFKSKTSQGFENFTDLDGREEIGPNHTTRYIFFDTGCVTFYLDQKNNHGYLAALLEDDGKKVIKIEKFSVSGERLWQAAIETISKSYEHYLNVLPEDHVAVASIAKSSLFTHELSENGKLLQTAELDFHLNNLNSYDETIYMGKIIHGSFNGQLTRASLYIKKLTPNQREFWLFSNYISSQGELITSTDRKEKALEIMFYKR